MRQLLHESYFLEKELTVSSALICIKNIRVTNTHTTHTNCAISWHRVKTITQWIRSDVYRRPLVNRPLSHQGSLIPTNDNSNHHHLHYWVYAKFFLCVHSFNPRNHLEREMLFASLYRMGSWGSENEVNLSKIAQLTGDRAETQPGYAYLPSPCFPFPHCISSKTHYPCLMSISYRSGTCLQHWILQERTRALDLKPQSQCTLLPWTYKCV